MSNVKNRLTKKAYANMGLTNKPKRGFSRIWFITFLLILTSLTLLATTINVTNAETQLSVKSSQPSPMVNITLKANSRSEISLRMKFYRLAISDIFQQDKFVVGLFSPDYWIILSDVDAYYENEESGTENSLIETVSLANFDNYQIKLILCRFPEEFRDSEGFIPNVTVKATLSEYVSSSEFIDGNKYYFPFDRYTLNLYVFFLEQKGNQSKMYLSYLEPEPESGLEKLSRPENEKKDVGEYPEIYAFSTLDNNVNPVIQLITFKYRTKGPILDSLAIFFWPFYFTIGLGMWLSLKHPNKESHLPIQILLTSTILLLTLSMFYVQSTPSEISYSVTMGMIASNAFLLMLGFAFVSVVSLFRQYGVGERLKQNLQF